MYRKNRGRDANRGATASMKGADGGDETPQVYPQRIFPRIDILTERQTQYAQYAEDLLLHMKSLRVVKFDGQRRKRLKTLGLEGTLSKGVKRKRTSKNTTSARSRSGVLDEFNNANSQDVDDDVDEFEESDVAMSDGGDGDYGDMHEDFEDGAGDDDVREETYNDEGGVL